jgi:hypothetical protein
MPPKMRRTITPSPSSSPPFPPGHAGQAYLKPFADPTRIAPWISVPGYSGVGLVSGAGRHRVWGMISSGITRSRNFSISPNMDSMRVSDRK